MATCKPDFPKEEAGTSDRRPDGVEGRMKRNRGNARRALARARWRSLRQHTAGSIPQGANLRFVIQQFIVVLFNASFSFTNLIFSNECGLVAKELKKKKCDHIRRGLCLV